MNLSEFLGRSKSKPKDVVAAVEQDGQWIYLKKPLEDWPQELRKLHSQELHFLFSNRHEDLLPEEDLCLCIGVKNCDLKERKEENPQCNFYFKGICIQQTMLHRDGEPLSLQGIGAFHGITKQRTHQIIEATHSQFIAELLKNPIIREYCESVAIGKTAAPDPEVVKKNILSAALR